MLLYAVPTWQNIPDHLQEKIERVQKKALLIFLSDASYSKAMQMAGHLKNVEKGCVLNMWTGFKTIH